MNLSSHVNETSMSAVAKVAYKLGHRDARHAASKLAAEQDAAVSRLRERNDEAVFHVTQLVNMLTAVRYTVGLGKTQLARIDSAKGFLATAPQPESVAGSSNAPA